eukprot:CAMPEP_0184644506 /NCGR_PEP_ID=MMETSP0308-20130426/1212_1 /TAXON_ID=38269 /ORGANISM="Gloeochaete witrockiana, Strain SAG 46.84" /LENGTH=320 /DNA_ID=CAMNT_0027073075 /DNA_START=162 /DNA_END=1121 /DNA_ORIENTATION=+
MSLSNSVSESALGGVLYPNKLPPIHRRRNSGSGLSKNATEPISLKDNSLDASLSTDTGGFLRPDPNLLPSALVVSSVASRRHPENAAKSSVLVSLPGSARNSSDIISPSYVDAENLTDSLGVCLPSPNDTEDQNRDTILSPQSDCSDLFAHSLHSDSPANVPGTLDSSDIEPSVVPRASPKSSRSRKPSVADMISAPSILQDEVSPSSLSTEPRHDSVKQTITSDMQVDSHEHNSSSRQFEAPNMVIDTIEVVDLGLEGTGDISLTPRSNGTGTTGNAGMGVSSRRRRRDRGGDCEERTANPQKELDDRLKERIVTELPW